VNLQQAVFFAINRNALFLFSMFITMWFKKNEYFDLLKKSFWFKTIMRTFIQVLLSIFFAIAIGTHIFYVINKDAEPFWWHCIYFATYGICWLMLFSKNKNAVLIYFLSAIFPFATHVFYASRHIINQDQNYTEIGVCILTCIMLALGFFWKKNQTLIEK
jgi:hypothetical protein